MTMKCAAVCFVLLAVAPAAMAACSCTPTVTTTLPAQQCLPAFGQPAAQGNVKTCATTTVTTTTVATTTVVTTTVATTTVATTTVTTTTVATTTVVTTTTTCPPCPTTVTTTVATTTTVTTTVATTTVATTTTVTTTVATTTVVTTTVATTCGGFTCKVCDLSVTDTNPASGKMTLKIQFGANQINGKIDETKVLGYMVFLTDNCGKSIDFTAPPFPRTSQIAPVGPIYFATVPKKATAAGDCCNAGRYALSITTTNTAAKYVLVRALTADQSDVMGFKTPVTDVGASVASGAFAARTGVFAVLTMLVGAVLA